MTVRVKEQKSMYNVQSTYHMLRCTYYIWTYFSAVWDTYAHSMKV
jgi:hypothetical protein